MVLAGAIVQR